jgi:DEAD/DEAH box helicase domain-containing protein
MGAPRASAIDALRGVGIALETVSTLALMCDPRDLGATLGDAAPEGEARPDDEASTIPPSPAMKMRGGPRPGYSPTLFLYEHIPGGTGLAQRIFEQRDVLLARAMTLVETCPCTSGCPACVGPCEEVREGVKGRKALAIEILRDAVG